MNGDLSIELAYFNSRLAVWEPLLEPVEVVNRSAFPDHAPWSLHFEVCFCKPAVSCKWTPWKKKTVRMDKLFCLETWSLIWKKSQNCLQYFFVGFYSEIISSLSRCHKKWELMGQKAQGRAAPHPPLRHQRVMKWTSRNCRCHFLPPLYLSRQRFVECACVMRLLDRWSR